jgi:preprotein translocase subunit YajC
MGQPGAPGQGGQGGGGSIQLLLMVVVFAIIYFMIIWPQQKQQKKHAEMVKALQKGDRVVAAGGIHGTVVGVDDQRGIVVLKVDENVKIEVQKSSVASKLDK